MRKKGMKKGESQKTELTTAKVLLIIALINLLEKLFDFIKTIIEKWGN